MPIYNFDPTGQVLANKITGEQQIITSNAHRNYHHIVPRYAPFFTTGLVISFRDVQNNVRTLVEGIDYYPAYQFIGASRGCAKPIYGGISFLNLSLAGVVTLSYYTLGGDWVLDDTEITTVLSDTLRNPRITSWEQVAAVPTVFPAIDHQWNLDDMVGMSQVVTKLDAVSAAIAARPVTAPLSNLVPTKNQIGLGNVDNFKTATDAEAITGTSIARFITPKALKAAITNAFSNFNNGVVTLLGLASTSSALSGAGLVGTPTGQTLMNAALQVRTIPELRALTAPVSSTNTTFVHVLGNVTIGDGAVDSFYWDNASALIDNGLTVVKPISNPATGRWISLQKDAFINERFTATNAQPTYQLVKAPLYGKAPRIILNKTYELIYTLDYYVSGREINFTYPLEVGDEVDISTQVKEIRTNNSSDNIYGKWIVTTNNQIFNLDSAPVHPQSLRVVVNDFLVLAYPVDFTINDALLSVSYPVEIGDQVEIMPHVAAMGMGAMALRSVLDY